MQSGNLYVYCINSPIIYCDPSGCATQKGNPPPPSSGFVPKKGKSPEESWNKERGGWEDKNGNIWVPDRAGHGKNRETGDTDHWDVQNPDGTGYVNVGKNGKQWGGKGKKPKLPAPAKVEAVETVAVAAGIVIVAYGIWEIVKWGAAIIAAPATGGGSLAIATVVP